MTRGLKVAVKRLRMGLAVRCRGARAPQLFPRANYVSRDARRTSLMSTCSSMVVPSSLNVCLYTSGRSRRLGPVSNRYSGASCKIYGRRQHPCEVDGRTPGELG